MTLAQFNEYVRRRHRAVGDTNWLDEEIYALITARCNEVLGLIGLLEETDTDTSVDGTQAYNLPSDCVRLVNLLYDGKQLQENNFREWETQKSDGSTPEGTPIAYAIWDRQVYLIPTPGTSGDTITFYYEKEHPFIDGTIQTTIDLPAVLHWRLADGVLADMFAKDLNQGMATTYEQKWLNVHIPAFYQYARRSKRGARVKTILDADSYPVTDRGMY